MRSPVREALEIASHGVPVFPCSSEKIPLLKLGPGFRNATTDPDLVRAWWSRWPDALVSVRTGIKFVVLDVDCAKHVEAMQWYEQALLPTTRTHITRSDGRHLLFQPDDRVRNTTSKICRGIDTKGINGCAVWWPACGWEVLHREKLAPFPDWIIKKIAPPPAPTRLPALRKVQSTERVQRQLEGIIRTIASAPTGERNAIAYWGASRLAEMVDQALISSNEAIDIAIEAASRAGLPYLEARRTAQSALDSQFRSTK
jgi:phage baseplate assembly protein W